MSSMRRGRFLFGSLGVALAVIGLGPVSASSANLSHSFQSDSVIAVGSLVSLDSKRSNYVEPANSDNDAHLFGVTVKSDDSLLAVDAAKDKIQVATTGSVTAIVSTLNGNIEVGDEIGVSPFEGIGMKAEVGSHIIGLSQTAFSARTFGATAQTVTDKQGDKHQIYVGAVRVNIGIGTASTTGEQVTGLQSVVKSITGHTVPTVRIVIALVITLIALFALITLIYSSIYGSIISIGRNPLAKYAIFRSLGSVMGMAVVAALVAAVTVFMLLR